MVVVVVVMNDEKLFCGRQLLVAPSAVTFRMCSIYSSMAHNTDNRCTGVNGFEYKKLGILCAVHNEDRKKKDIKIAQSARGREPLRLHHWKS